MKGLRPYLVIGILLAAIALYLYLTRRSGTYAPSESEFAVPDTGIIGFVEISAGENRLVLERTGSKWMVDGYPVRMETLRGLLILVSRLEVEAPVSRALSGRVQEGLQQRSTAVRIGLGGGREKRYRVYYDPSADDTFAMLYGSGQAFRIRVRGYREANLQELFRVDERYWRDNLILNLFPEDIRAVILRNSAEPDQSFHLVRNAEGEFEIARGIVPHSWSPASQESLSQYLGYFANVRFEAFLDPVRDTLVHEPEPDYTLRVENLEGERTVIELFAVYHITEAGERRLDYDRLYGRIGNRDEWVVLKYIQIDPLLKEFAYFSGA